jgi:autotransporter-associated beta strand protein
LSGTGTIDNTGGSGASILTTGADNTNTSFSGIIQNTAGKLAVTKSGSGTWTLSGANTYTGTTTVGAGTLNVTGSLAAGSAANVGAGATLSGTGSVGGPIMVAGGAIQPGTSTSIGILTAKRADLSGGNGSALKARIWGTTTPGINYDRLNLTDTLVLGGNSELDLDMAGLTGSGIASGFVLAKRVVDTFKMVKILNYTGTLGVSIVYSNASIDVAFRNIAPFFTAGSDQTVLEDAGAQALPNWATAISAGSPLESGQTVGFVATNSNTTLFTVQPAISPTGTLTFTPAADANGSATVTVKIGDNGGTANGGVDSSAVQTFKITVTSVNDAPSFAKGPNLSLLLNAPAQNVPSWATSIAAGPANESGQILGFRISNSNNALFSVQPTLSSSGTLAFTPAAAKLGAATVYLRLGDNGGTANGGIDSSALDSFTIQIHPPLTFRLNPDTLRIRPGDFGTFSILAKNGGGADTAVSTGEFTWSWSNDLGTLASGHVAANHPGNSVVRVQGYGLTDSGIVIVAPLDTALPGSNDSVFVPVGHGVIAVIPPHGNPLKIGVAISDSILGRGIAGADTAIHLTGSADSVILKVPLTLVPTICRSAYGSPTPWWVDSLGKVHAILSATRFDSSLVFVGIIGRTYWLGYDTFPPKVGVILTSDSVSNGNPVRIDWTLSDNVVGTGAYLCLLKAGNSAATCSLLVASDSAHGSLALVASQIPFGARIWLEGRDDRNTTESNAHDIVTRVDTLRASVPRQEDRYEMLSFPYTAGKGSAHTTFQRMWGPDNPKYWRAFKVDTATNDFAEILPGDTLDAFGSSFWVRTRKVDLVPWVAGGWTSPISTPVNITLQPGWNAVGNPCGFDVSWTQIRKLSLLDSIAVFGPYRFDASKQNWDLPETTFTWSAWTGVALLNSSGRALSLQVPSIASGRFAARTQTQTVAPRLRLCVTSSQGADTALGVWLGIDSSATLGWNAQDHPLPPSPCPLRLSLPPPAGSVANVPFFTGVKPFADTGVGWILHAQGLRQGTPLVLGTIRTGTDTSIAVWIHDEKSGRWLAATGRMEFAVGTETNRDFYVLVGPAPKGVGVQRTFGLVTHGRALAWSLPDEMGRTRVKIELLDMLGRKTTTLLDEEMDPGSYVREFTMPHSLAQQLVHLTAGGKQATLIRLRTR